MPNKEIMYDKVKNKGPEGKVVSAKEQGAANPVTSQKD
jgi:hypothetical protein